MVLHSNRPQDDIGTHLGPGSTQRSSDDEKACFSHTGMRDLLATASFANIRSNNNNIDCSNNSNDNENNGISNNNHTK